MRSGAPLFSGCKSGDLKSPVMNKNCEKKCINAHGESGQVCTVRIILGRHLTDLGVCVDRCAFISRTTLRPFYADILERKQWSRPCFRRKTDSLTTVQNPKTPLRGKIIPTPPPRPRDRSGQPAGSTRPQTTCPDRILRWVLRIALRFAIWRERCMLTWIGMPSLAPYQATAAAGTPMSAVGAVGVCYD